MNKNGWGLSFLRARAILTLIASLILGGALPVRAVTFSDSIKALKDQDPQVRAEAAGALVKAGVKAVPELAAGLNNRNRMAIISVLAKIGAPAIPALMKLLDKAQTRSQAGDALFQLATPVSARAQVPGLIKCMQTPDLKQICGQILAKVIDGQSKDKVPAILKALSSKDKDVRMYAAVALGRLGALAGAAVPALAAALKDREAQVRMSAASALGAIGAASAAPALKAALNDADPQVQREAKKALKRLRA